MKNTFLDEFATKEALAEFIRKSTRLSMGEKCVEFEEAFAAFQGSKHGILFNSGGSANLAMIQALKNLGKLKDGDKVGFSALTWSTNTMPIIQMGLVPVPIDCTPGTLNVMASNLKERLKDTKIDAFFSTNVLGLAGDLDQVKEFCEDNDIIYIEDNCESLGTKLKAGQLTGCYGLGASFSFFVAHHMSTVEGGMVCTSNDELAEMLHIVRANGWDRNLTSEQQIKWRKKFNIKSEFDAKYTFYDLGFNLRPTEITGFLGLTQLKFLRDNIDTREKNFKRIHEVIKQNDDLISYEFSHIDKLSMFATPILCKSQELKQKYMNQFSGAGIEIRPMIAGNMQKQPFYSKYSDQTYDLAGTDLIHEQGFYCGNYPELSESDIQTIIGCLTNY